MNHFNFLNGSSIDTRLLNTSPSSYSLSGTKCIDADTGLIYFKYDFGYEFGILFPGEGRKYIAGGSKTTAPYSKQFLHNSAGAIDVPVLHEKTIKQKLWKQRNRPDIYDMLGRKKPIGKNPSTVSFNIDELHCDSPRIRPHIPRKGAYIFIINSRTFVNCCFVLHIFLLRCCI